MPIPSSKTNIPRTLCTRRIPGILGWILGAFFVVYIKEAHAVDSSWAMGGSDGMPIVEDAVTLDARMRTAKVCMTKLELEALPALVDDMQDTANEGYAAWPDRLYLVGEDGRIAYHGGRGPMGFKPDELQEAIEAQLAKAVSARGTN